MKPDQPCGAGACERAAREGAKQLLFFMSESSGGPCSVHLCASDMRRRSSLPCLVRPVHAREAGASPAGRIVSPAKVQGATHQEDILSRLFRRQNALQICAAELPPRLVTRPVRRVEIDSCRKVESSRAESGEPVCSDPGARGPTKRSARVPVRPQHSRTRTSRVHAPLVDGGRDGLLAPQPMHAEQRIRACVCGGDWPWLRMWPPSSSCAGREDHPLSARDR